MSDAEDAASEPNVGRFAREFCEMKAIGSGQFSTVYRARHQVDRCLYAVKRTKPIPQGHLQRELREAVALAQVACPHVVRYFSSWIEDGCLHIQTELCEGGSLRDRLAARQRTCPADPRFLPGQLAEVMHHVASGLAVLHGRGFAHLDIKPDNILVARECYKIADLGLATAACASGCDDICEGDCRYLAFEVLQGNLSNLPKADIFALGLVCYELATNPKELPYNGEEWQSLRAGHLNVSLMPPLPEGMLALLLKMVGRAASERPPAEDIMTHECVAPPDGIQMMREKTQQAQQEAERSRKLADVYWQEMVSMKKNELMGESSCRTAPPPSPKRLSLARTA